MATQVVIGGVVAFLQHPQKNAGQPTRQVSGSADVRSAEGIYRFPFKMSSCPDHISESRYK